MTSAPLLAPGATLRRRFRVVAQVGGGEHRATFEAEDVEGGDDEPRGRACAVEVFQASRLPEPRQRALTRRVALARGLDCPGLLTPYDAGLDDDHPLFVVAARWLDGADLASICKQSGPVPAEQVAAWIRQSAATLAVAHATGIGHGQLSASSLFFSRDEAGGATVIVLDFCTATVVERPGAAVFRAPELLETGAEITPSADIYALAHISHSLLTGTPYFASAWREGPASLRAAALRGADVPPSERARAARVTVPAAFDRWFAVATHVRPEKRFDDVLDAAEALALALGARASTRGVLARVMAHGDVDLGDTIPSDDVDADKPTHDVPMRRATEPRATEPRATEPRATEPRATEPRASEPSASVPGATLGAQGDVGPTASSGDAIDPLGDTQAGESLADAAERAVAAVRKRRGRSRPAAPKSATTSPPADEPAPALHHRSAPRRAVVIVALVAALLALALALAANRP